MVKTIVRSLRFTLTAPPLSIVHGCTGRLYYNIMLSSLVEFETCFEAKCLPSFSLAQSRKPIFQRS